MKPEILLQEYESSRGLLRDLPGHELLTLVGRLATEFFVRKHGDIEAIFHLHESVSAGLGVGRAILEARADALEKCDRTRKN